MKTFFADAVPVKDFQEAKKIITNLKPKNEKLKRATENDAIRLDHVVRLERKCNEERLKIKTNEKKIALLSSEHNALRSSTISFMKEFFFCQG